MLAGCCPCSSSRRAGSCSTGGRPASRSATPWCTVGRTRLRRTHAPPRSAPGRSSASCGPSPIRTSRRRCCPAQLPMTTLRTCGGASTADSARTDPATPTKESPPMHGTRPVFDGVLFFPVTPFTESGEVDLDLLARHVGSGVDAGPGGVFIACGTGEFHALEAEEFGRVVRAAVEVVAGRVPVYAGAGGAVSQAKVFARKAEEAGADGLLLLPPYLVEMPQAGLLAYTREVAAVTGLPVIVYNRNNARYTEASAVEVAKIPTVVGFKDGTGDLD